MIMSVVFYSKSCSKLLTCMHPDPAPRPCDVAVFRQGSHWGRLIQKKHLVRIKPTTRAIIAPILAMFRSHFNGSKVLCIFMTPLLIVAEAIWLWTQYWCFCLNGISWTIEWEHTNSWFSWIIGLLMPLPFSLRYMECSEFVLLTHRAFCHSFVRAALDHNFKYERDRHATWTRQYLLLPK